MGADRALKRLALQRVRDIDLWKAPLVRVGEPAAAARGKLDRLGGALPAPGRRRGPPARLAVGAGAGRRADHRRAALAARAGASRLDDVLRDALSDLLAEEAQYGPVVDERGAVAGVLSIEILSQALQRGPGSGPERGRCAVTALLAQVEIHDRTEDTCVSDNGFCPGWIVDNFDRYVDPFFQHVLLTVVAVAIGFADRVHARAGRLPAPLARRPGHPGHRRSSTRSRASRRSSCCCRSPGAASTTAIIALVAYTLLIIFRNILDRPRQRARGDARTPAAAWASPTASCCGASSCRWRCRRSWPGCASRRPPTVGLATLAFFAGRRRARRADLRRHHLQVERGRRPAGWPCCWRRCSTGPSCLTQRALTPWTRRAA